MGRHSQPDLHGAAPAPPAPPPAPPPAAPPAGRFGAEPDDGHEYATGDPAWEHWWEKTGAQPRIMDPIPSEAEAPPARPASRPTSHSGERRPVGPAPSPAAPSHLVGLPTAGQSARRRPDSRPGDGSFDDRPLSPPAASYPGPASRPQPAAGGFREARGSAGGSPDERGLAGPASYPSVPPVGGLDAARPASSYPGLPPLGGGFEGHDRPPAGPGAEPARGPARPGRPVAEAYPGIAAPGGAAAASSRPGLPPLARAGQPYPGSASTDDSSRPGLPPLGRGEPYPGSASAEQPGGRSVDSSRPRLSPLGRGESYPGLAPLEQPSGRSADVSRPGLPPLGRGQSYPAAAADSSRPGLPPLGAGESYPGLAPLEQPGGRAAAGGPGTGPMSAAFPVSPPADAPRPPAGPMPSRRSLRSVSGPADAAPPAAAGDAGGPRSGRRPQGPLAAGGVAAAAALPEPYDTAPPLSAYQPGPGGNGYDPVGDQLAGSEPVTRGAGREDRSRRRRRSDRNERTDTSIAAVTGLLPPPPQGRDAGPAGERAGRRPAVRAVPDPELADPAGQWSAEHRSAERRPTAKEARRASRAAAIDFPDPDADRDVPPDSPALAIQRAEPAAARPLRAVEVEPGVNIDPDIDPDSSIHYGFEEDEEPSLLVQWGVFFLQTIVGAAGGLGVWLGFHVLWDRWPFYAAAAVGVALAGMLVIARALRRRYGHELDLLTVLVAVGVGVVLTVLPAAFALHSL